MHRVLRIDSSTVYSIIGYRNIKIVIVGKYRLILLLVRYQLAPDISTYINNGFPGNQETTTVFIHKIRALSFYFFFNTCVLTFTNRTRLYVNFYWSLSFTILHGAYMCERNKCLYHYCSYIYTVSFQNTLLAILSSLLNNLSIMNSPSENR